MKQITAIIVLILAQSLAFSQGDYPDLNQISKRLKALDDHPKVKLTTLTKTLGGNDIYALKIGTGDLDNKPAIAVVGGVEGYHVLSVELALQFAERLVTEEADVLDGTTFYVFPNMSPEAYAQYHDQLKYERRGNASSLDHDRDGRMNEDPYEDLNNDGFITQIRIESPVGKYISHPDDARAMVEVDTSSSDATRYQVYSEGFDNDKDDKFNEGLKEAYAFNKIFSFKFPVFEPLAGDYAVSQIETRALLDYLYKQFNIYAFVTFGPANNLSSPLKYDAQEAKKRIVSSPLKGDVAINKMISEIYNESISQKPYKQDNHGTDGDFFQWAYFHFGRLSFSTPGWWVPEAKKDTTSASDKKIKETEVSNFLKWAEQENLDNVFIEWEKINHPSFKNQTVEVGGVKPFVMENPPFSKVDSIALEHTNFILKLAQQQQKLEFHNLKVEDLNGGLKRITVDLLNNGNLPSHSELGQRSRWLKKIRVDLNLSEDDIIVGNNIELIDRMEALETKTLSWVIKGNGKVNLKAGAPHTGFTELNINL
ncbi:M14 family metallopeptidase [Psychroflexus sediminis]|uniref:Zinc carboxypeptidase n=1 Tax=Psychroflexus sediminis TaxID=470826 RepID=A0A1G7X6A5_9FLAO|nr:M14 family metallopeptidase [Psychroflexus sediminis]SDG79683.1 Zinc carboxypeptidase [Psychroflexus sediminis]